MTIFLVLLVSSGPTGSRSTSLAFLVVLASYFFIAFISSDVIADVFFFLYLLEDDAECVPSVGVEMSIFAHDDSITTKYFTEGENPDEHYCWEIMTNLSDDTGKRVRFDNQLVIL